MALQDDARELLEALERGMPVGTAFLGLFKFIEESPNGRFGWLALGEKAITGVECDHQIDRYQERLRSLINDDLPITWCGEIAGLRGVLHSLANGEALSAELSKSLVIGLRVLDAAFRGVHPAEVGIYADDDGFAKLRTLTRFGKPLFSSNGMEVYPKPKRLLPAGLRGQRRLTDVLDNLCVINQTPLLKVIHLCAFASRTPGPRGFLRIGIIPTINAHEELLWTKEAHSRYSLQVRPELETAIQERVRQGLDWLLANEAELIVMPELVSAPSLNPVVEGELSRRQAAGLFTPCLVLSGTQLVKDVEERTRNRACVFDGEGDIAWEQDKLHAYRFSVREQSDAGHPLGVEDLEDRIEAIDVEPRTLYVVDISPTQRIVVLTCEDFIQPDPHRAVITDMVATTILVPIMSGTRANSETGWVQDAALNFVRHPGATSVVANSGALLGGATDDWQFGHIVSAARPTVTWSAHRAEEGPPIAWLADLSEIE